MILIIVAVQRGLDEIRNGLISKGYEVVDMETYKYPVDAIVYEGNSFEVSHISYNNMTYIHSGQKTNYGVFMINSLGNTIDQIDEMLRMKCYSHMF